MNWINRDLIVECLRELSDLKLQRELWLSSGGDRVSSFVEAVEQLFTDSGLGDELESSATGLGSEAERALALLEKQLAKVNRRQSVLDMLNDPAMQCVRELAYEILKLLKED